jgi:hypothetical protein
MATLLRLQILSNDHKVTLEAYLRKLEGHIEDLKDVLARIPFAVTHKVASAQLGRLTGLDKTIRHIIASRLTYGRVVNNLPAPIKDDPNVGVPFDGHEPNPDEWNDTPSPANGVNENIDDEQDRQDPGGPARWHLLNFPREYPSRDTCILRVAHTIYKFLNEH